MTCREAKRLLKSDVGGGKGSLEDEALALHLTACHRCSEAMKVARLSSALLGALREEIEPGPSFYPRLRDRLMAEEICRPGSILLQAWGFARQLIPAAALGVLLLAGITISLGRPPSPLPVQGMQQKEIYAFSMEELNLPAAVGQPTKDQMLAFVLMQGEARAVKFNAPDAMSGK